MPPKQSTTSSRGRGASTAGRPSKSNNATSKTQSSSSSKARPQPSNSHSAAPINLSDMSDLDPFADDDDRPQQRRREGRQDTTMDIDDDEQQRQSEQEDSDEEERKTIPPELLTHVLHQFFEKDGSRVTKDANTAIAKYMDIFVREAVARTVVQKEKGFLEVEDLEKVVPQLLLDL